MKSFAYTALDREGRAVRGAIEAENWPAALALLTGGLSQIEQAVEATRQDDLPPLTSTEAMELAGYLSQLARSGLTLSGGLQALAADLPQGRLSQTLDDLSKRLAAGASLAAAVDALSSRLPPHVRQLIVAGAQSGHLSQSLDRLLAHERGMDDMTRQFWQAVMYPAILFGFLVAWLLFAALWLVPEIHLDDWREMISNSRGADPSSRIMEFSRVAPPLIFGLLAGVVLLAASVRIFGGRGAVSRLAAQLPLVGKAWWYRGLTEFSGLLTVFLDEGLTLVESLRLTALAARDPAVAMACTRAVDQVAAGRELAQCFERGTFVPPTMVNLIRWGQRESTLAGALHAARGMFLDRFELQTQLARLILPPIVFLLIAGSVIFLATGLGSLLRLITDLSG